MTASSSDAPISEAAMSEATAAAMAAAGLVPGQSPAPLRLPDAAIFARRAARLRALAEGHAMGDWLRFVATLADAQAAVAATPAALPPEEQWATDLRALAARLDSLPGGAREALTALAASDPDTLEALAGRWAGDALEDGDLAAAPFLAAAFQTAWTRHAAALDPASVTTHATATATATACPVCGGAPVAGVLQVGMESGGLRYLHCGICHTAWHHVRSSCVACGDGKDVSQRFVEGADGTEANGAVRAEACDACHSYLKLLFLEKAPGLDPVADDLATLALDLLLGEEDYRRIGVNPFLAVTG
ncbi:formate dehydrogenase accessory protein FdhE [Azospirillum brasilense]|uniref:formate dehydrogenase accessory protein FdhE domain-containing protein n=1 Tax=Azospirillum brasilense TaxID=192 RepID=UPI001EDAEB6B|nr:formate dehydrogenase accessory protein FdhE [Azospirillum brasilense]UKJ74979.1 formate dehydrogenase accessory protein FdhE [Azospirillum brasilense]